MPPIAPASRGDLIFGATSGACALRRQPPEFEATADRDAMIGVGAINRHKAAKLLRPHLPRHGNRRSAVGAPWAKFRFEPEPSLWRSSSSAALRTPPNA